jgi:hypothetical protein
VQTEFKYGVKWEKILFISIPIPYVNKSNSSKKIENVAYYAGVTPSFKISFEKASVSLSPNIHGNIGANICNIIGADLYAESGIEEKLTITYDNTYLKGTAAAMPYTSLSARIKVGIDGIPVIGFIGYQQSFELLKNARKTYEAVVFQKKI